MRSFILSIFLLPVLSCGKLSSSKSPDPAPADSTSSAPAPARSPGPSPQPAPIPDPSKWPVPSPLPTPAPIPSPTPSPSPVPKPSPTPAPSPAPGSTVSQVLDLLNRRRADAGLAPVAIDQKLTCASDHHAADIGAAKACRHNSSNGEDPWGRMKDCGVSYSAAGEVIACNIPDPNQAVTALYNDPPHREIMLGNFTLVGISMVNGYLVVDFIKP